MKPNSLFTTFILSMLVTLQLHAEPRPVTGKTEGDKVEIKTLAITLQPPAGTTLYGPRAQNEHANYAFPWLRTPQGFIDLATVPNAEGNTLREKLASWTKLNKQSPQPWTVTSLVGIKHNGIAITRIGLYQKKDYPVVRYFFLTEDNTLAYLHLHGWQDLEKLEAIAATMKFKEAGSEPAQ